MPGFGLELGGGPAAGGQVPERGVPQLVQGPAGAVRVVRRAAELDERTGQALSARTGEDLAGLMADLPPLAVAEVTDAAGPRRAGYRALAAWAAVAVAAIGSVVVVLAVRGPGHGALFPWWLIPFAFLVLRRLGRSTLGADDCALAALVSRITKCRLGHDALTGTAPSDTVPSVTQCLSDIVP